MNGTFWQSRPVFVTGATGFMGGWLVKALLDCGAEVVALVRDHTPRCIFVREKLHERPWWSTVAWPWLSTAWTRYSTWQLHLWSAWPLDISHAVAALRHAGKAEDQTCAS